jgi:uncharacterized protein YbaR (Trm112 family)
MLDPRLLELLCCPAVDGGTPCRGELRETPGGLACGTCGRVYPVVDGIPVMLQDQAVKEAR